MKSLHTMLALLLLLLGFSGSGQILSYEVYKGGKTIGAMNVVRQVKDSVESVQITSNVEFKVLFTFEVEYGLNETFVNGILKEGEGFNRLNGSTQKDYAIKKRKSSYSLKLSDVPNTINEAEIRTSVSQIYFDEPYDGKKVFSQHFARYLVFEKIDTHTYRLTSPDGVNTYGYENGICTEVEVARDFATVQFKMKPESYAIVKNKADTLRNK